MSKENVRAILALLVVGVFMVITATLALYPIFGKSNVEMDAYASFFSKTASVYTGIIGVIIGYYFAQGTGRRADAKPDPSETDDGK
jgi:hypothetical protein